MVTVIQDFRPNPVAELKQMGSTARFDDCSHRASYDGDAESAAEVLVAQIVTRFERKLSCPIPPRITDCTDLPLHAVSPEFAKRQMCDCQ
jgi:hypothetical protein